MEPRSPEVLGYTNAEALGHTLHEFIVPQEYRDKLRATFPEFQRTGKGAAIGETHEVRALRKDGVEIAIALSLSAVRIKGGWHGVSSIRDITARKQAEAAVIERTRQVEAVREVAPRSPGSWTSVACSV